MPEFEHLRAVRAVAAAAALDAAEWGNEDASVLRTAPDEALAIGTTYVAIGDPDAIVEPEAGFVVAVLGSDEVDALAAHVDWPIPTARGSLVQGKIDGVPAKLLIGEPTLLVTNAAYAEELARRLGW